METIFAIHFPLKKSKGEKSQRKESDSAQDEIKKFKENLLQSAPAGE